jgi:hypothetical protein
MVATCSFVASIPAAFSADVMLIRICLLVAIVPFLPFLAV